MPATIKVRVVNLKEERCDIRVDRSSKFGNPFKIGMDGDRPTVIKKHRLWLLGKIHPEITWMGRTGPEVMELVHELHGLTLGCWCTPHACHGDFLLETANRFERL